MVPILLLCSFAHARLAAESDRAMKMLRFPKSSHRATERAAFPSPRQLLASGSIVLIYALAL